MTPFWGGAQVLPVAQQQPAQSLELFGYLGVPGPAEAVPLLPAHLVEGVRGPLNGMESVQADDGIGSTCGHHRADPLGPVAAHESQLGRALVPEGIEEGTDGVLAAAFGCPDHLSCQVVTDNSDSVESGLSSPIGPAAR
jgi:hypothetical protein